MCAPSVDELIALFEADVSSRAKSVESADDVLALMGFIQGEYLLDCAAVEALTEGQTLHSDDQRSGFSVDELKELAQARKDAFDDYNDSLPSMGYHKLASIDARLELKENVV